MSQDSIITCRDCGREFTFTSEEQQHFSARGFSAPARCPDCRKKRSPRRRKKPEQKPVAEQKAQSPAPVRRHSANAQPRPVEAQQAKQSGGRSRGRRGKESAAPVKQQGREQQPTKPQAEQKSNETYTAPCDVCGKEAVLRYRPTGLLPVYCRECFEEKLNAKADLYTRDAGPRKRDKVSLDAYKPLSGPPA